MNGFNQQMAQNMITLFELFQLYDYYCDCKYDVSFERYVMDFRKLNPNCKIIN